MEIWGKEFLQLLATRGGRNHWHGSSAPQKQHACCHEQCGSCPLELLRKRSRSAGSAIASSRHDIIRATRGSCLRRVRSNYGPVTMPQSVLSPCDPNVFVEATAEYDFERIPEHAKGNETTLASVSKTSAKCSGTVRQTGWNTSTSACAFKDAFFTSYKLSRRHSSFFPGSSCPSSQALWAMTVARTPRCCSCEVRV